MDNAQLPLVIRRVKQAVKPFKTPVVTEISRQKDPFRVLVSCILSLRTRDEVTDLASRRLFALADTPQTMLELKPKQIEKAIYPAAFFRNKSRSLLELCRELIETYAGKVPDSIDELLKLKGVGRKTANLTVILGYGGFGICVDTHVHRISNRWGYIKTRSADESEMALRQKLPKRYWKGYNDLLVTFGQNICKPLSPLCSQCSVSDTCEQVGVGRCR